MSRAVMQQALEALEDPDGLDEYNRSISDIAITALRQALAEPEQPVEYVRDEDNPCYMFTAPTPKPEQKGWFTVSELNEWATKLPQTTHWEGCEAVHPECRKQEQEPIGHADLGINNIYIFNELEPRAVPAGRTPLYTAPTPRRPLSDEEIIEHFEAEVDTGLLSSFADGVRFAERAHGITGERHD